jgi:hypothetical protein
MNNVKPKKKKIGWGGWDLVVILKKFHIWISQTNFFFIPKFFYQPPPPFFQWKKKFKNGGWLMPIMIDWWIY